MENKQMKNLVKGALILSVASFIAKLLSAVYRVPFQNLVGDTGFYVYQQVYPIYGIGMTFSLSGLPLFISKLVAEEREMGRQRQVIRQSFLILLVVGIIVFCLLQFFARPIALAMDDVRLAPLIQSVSFMFLIMPILAVSRGFFQGTFNMLPAATSQVTEQIIRVAIILIAAGLFIPLHWSVYTMGTYAMSGSAIGGLVAGYLLYRHMRHELWYDLAYAPRQQVKKFFSMADNGRLLRRFWLEGGSICLFAGMIILLQLVDSFTVKRGLVLRGVPELEAQALKGIYDRGQPLVQLGLVVGTAFSSTLLPGLTHALVKARFGLFYRTGKSMIRISLAISLAATAGLMILMPFINLLLFGDAKETTALSIYMCSILFVTVISTYTSVLQSLDDFKITTRALLIGLAVKIIFNQSFVEAYGTNGASLVTVFALGITFVLVFSASPIQLKQALFEQGYLFKLFLSMLVMVFSVGISNFIVVRLIDVTTRSGAGIVTFIGIFVGLIAFMGSALVLHLFTLREWLVFPYGKKILKKLSKSTN